MIKLRRWFLEDDEKLVRVKSWIPSWGMYNCLEWPAMLVDYPGGRKSVVPLWDWARLRAPFRNVRFRGEAQDVFLVFTTGGVLGFALAAWIFPLIVILFTAWLFANRADNEEAARSDISTATISPDKGGTNTWPSQIESRPPAPAPTKPVETGLIGKRNV